MAGVVYDGIGSYMLSSVELILAHVLPHGSGLLVGQIVVIKLYFKMTEIAVTFVERRIVRVGF